MNNFILYECWWRSKEYYVYFFDIHRVERKIFPSSSLLMFLMNFLACLADEELQAEEETIEELRRKAEEERFRAQLEAQKREEERRMEEERRYAYV